jgi:hypothetical protein
MNACVHANDRDFWTSSDFDDSKEKGERPFSGQTVKTCLLLWSFGLQALCAMSNMPGSDEMLRIGDHGDILLAVDSGLAVCMQCKNEVLKTCSFLGLNP